MPSKVFPRKFYRFRARNLLFAMILAPFLFLSSCEKIFDTPDEKKPTELRFEFAMGVLELSEDKDGVDNNGEKLQKASSKFTIESGFIAISNIEFDGRRQEGEDVYFVSDFDEPYLIDLTGEYEDVGISFDIPQGIYTTIEITLHIGAEGYSALTMKGDYRQNVHRSIPVLFDYGYPEQIRVRARPGAQKDQIVLTKDAVSTARVLVETESLLRLVNYGMIIQADVVEIDGEEIILINEHTNAGLFNSISSRMNNSFEVVIE